jgi:hypothetical protein
VTGLMNARRGLGLWLGGNGSEIMFDRRFALNVFRCLSSPNFRF